MTQQVERQLSLGTAAARNLATTTKSAPQMRGISPRWLLRVLPWEEATGGTYRVNRRVTYRIGDGRVSFTGDGDGDGVRVVGSELCELPLLRGFTDISVLEALAGQFVPRDVAAGEVIAASGRPADQVVLLVHGKARKTGAGRYGDETRLGVLVGGDYFGDQKLVAESSWDFTVTALTRCTVLTLPRQAFQAVLATSETLRDRVEQFQARSELPQNKYGEGAIELASGHAGEPELPGTFVDYELAPREYELSVAQTVLRVHTRVSDLYSHPMNQLDEQLRLTVEALRERQESELVNNPDFGLLHNTDRKQRIHTRAGPPTPDDVDELLARRRKTRYLLAHPRTIVAFGRECNRRGVNPPSVERNGRQIWSWRGVPFLPCDKIPITGAGTTAVMAMRTGVEDEGVIGLYQTGIPEEYRPGLNVRFMGIDDRAISSYLVSAYYSVAVLVPDALGVLEGVELGREG